MASNELANKYQKKSDKEHVLYNPDTYIGSVENVESYNWIYENEKKIFEYKQHKYIPGLYKLFDEGIVNSRDHVVRMMNKNPVTYINIAITEEEVIFVR